MTAGVLIDDFSSGQIELLAQGRRLSHNSRFSRARGTGVQPKALVPASKSAGPTEQELLALGSIVGERYRILGIAGQGGMGIVYRAQDLEAHRIVALKMLRKDSCTDEQAFRRFQKEAQAASWLNHPHIVSIHDFGMPSGSQAFLAMDFLEGTSLQRIINEESWLERDRFQHIFMQACDALEHAHKNGIVHRDVKPSNLLLVDRPENPDWLVIVDFGLVKLMSAFEDQRVTTTHTIVGSPLYMSPEQCKRLPVDHRSDIYALGCSMYEALCGSPPHMGDSPLETFCKHISEQPEPLHQRNPYLDIPPALEQAVMKALAKDPLHRQQTMAQLKEEIEQTFKRQNSISASLQIVKSAATPVHSFPTVLLNEQPTAQANKYKPGISRALWLVVLPALILLASAMVALSIQYSTNQDNRASSKQPQRAAFLTPEPAAKTSPRQMSQPLPAIAWPDKPEAAAKHAAKRVFSHKTHKRQPRHWTYYYWYSRGAR